jgi:tetratricopeptide (TPR) repeat protein
MLSLLRELAKIDKHDDEEIGAMERMIELRPDDEETRFLLAYKHSEIGNNDLALFHYLKIREAGRDSGTWNNLGVAFEQAGLPAKAVNAYRHSEEVGGSLAMSNLARKFMTAGFLVEAQQECERGLAVEDSHQNVASTLGELKGVPDAEEKREAEHLEKARPVSDFYKHFGRAFVRPNPTEISPRWRGPECELAVKIDGNEFEASGSYEQQGLGGLLSGLATSFGVRTPTTPDRYHIKYKGVVRGNAIDGMMTRVLEDDPTKVRGLLSSTEFKTNVPCADSAADMTCAD